ncbi:MAG TPA: hypothetical protein VF744_12235 [Beijerinckiaceae bacterium]
MDKNLFFALEALEREYGIPVPKGALQLPPFLRYSAILVALRARICPHAKTVQSALNDRATEASAIIADAIGSFVTSTPFIIATLARCLLSIGIERFCENPNTLFDNSER